LQKILQLEITIFKGLWPERFFIFSSEFFFYLQLILWTAEKHFLFKENPFL